MAYRILGRTEPGERVIPSAARAAIRLKLLLILLLGGREAISQPPPVGTCWRPPNGIVALLTDYGEQDFYIGALKGAILTSCQTANIIDLTHQIPEYDVRRAAYALWDAAREFPDGTVFVAIVDPGVGTTRRALVLQSAKGNWFVGPDNGIFTVVEREMGPSAYREITNRDWMRSGPISATFHGRDIFGPAAGNLVCGDPFSDAGPVVKDPVRLELPIARVEGDRLIGEVLFADRYGNLQTNIPAGHLDSLGIALGETLRVAVAERSETAPFVRAYGDVPVGAILVFAASTDRIEIALNQASAADFFGAGGRSPVILRRGD